MIVKNQNLTNFELKNQKFDYYWHWKPKILTKYDLKTLKTNFYNFCSKTNTLTFKNQNSTLQPKIWPFSTLKTPNIDQFWS